VARRSSLARVVTQLERDAARRHAAQQRSERQAVRAAQQARAAYVRASAADAREQKRLYVESRRAEVDELNEDLVAIVEALEGVLAAALAADCGLDWSSMKRPPRLPVWGDAALEIAIPEPDPATFRPAAATGVGKLFGKKKHDEAVAAGEAAYAAAVRQHEQQDQVRRHELARRRGLFEQARAIARARTADEHAEVDRLHNSYDAGDPEAITTYVDLVLSASRYPEGFPQSFRLVYVPASRQVVVEYDLPPVAVVPTVKAHRYVNASDSVTEAPRPAAQVRALYASVVAQVALRTVHEVLRSDRGRYIDVVVINGLLDSIDPGSGRAVRPCLVTLRTTRDLFEELDLSQVHPLACLRHLSAGVSKSPAELVPVRPVVELNMVDRRFVAEADALSILEQRPNLMELTPTEFESLIQNLFTKMGLEARQTQASRDGGVDCVAFDTRPIFGGKVIIQAKRYRHTVGVSAVRDLFGTLQNEGASKGILVTTSSYGQSSFDFIRNKPIELIEGAHLLYLLQEHAGLVARIEMPQDWVDPVADSPVTPSPIPDAPPSC